MMTLLLLLSLAESPSEIVSCVTPTLENACTEGPPGLIRGLCDGGQVRKAPCATLAVLASCVLPAGTRTVYYVKPKRTAKATQSYLKAANKACEANKGTFEKHG